jgi:hypothetical protein
VLLWCGGEVEAVCTKELVFIESLKQFGNHRSGKLESYYRVFVIRIICITYLEGLQYFNCTYFSIYSVRCKGG